MVQLLWSKQPCISVYCSIYASALIPGTSILPQLLQDLQVPTYATSLHLKLKLCPGRVRSCEGPRFGWVAKESAVLERMQPDPLHSGCESTILTIRTIGIAFPSNLLPQPLVFLICGTFSGLRRYKQRRS